MTATLVLVAGAHLFAPLLPLKWRWGFGHLYDLPLGWSLIFIAGWCSI